jgi:hypothetical protein
MGKSLTTKNAKTRRRKVKKSGADAMKYCEIGKNLALTTRQKQSNFSRVVARPHPNPVASQARHKSVSPHETFASRNVVPQERGNARAPQTSQRAVLDRAIFAHLLSRGKEALNERIFICGSWWRHTILVNFARLKTNQAKQK